MSEVVCRKCSRALTPDERGLYLRMVNRGAESFLCINCLSEHLEVPVPLLYEKIDYLKKSGCTLFG